MKQKTIEILNALDELFPDAKCELNYATLYELTCAVMLSAQTTDVSVNKVTPKLFERYPTVDALSKASLIDVENCIKTLGLYHNKAKNLISFAKQVMEFYDGKIPNSMEELTKLDGIGRKTANVILSEYFDVPRIAVDTHVERISKRLGFAKANDTVLEVEKKLMKEIQEEKWSHSHHAFIFFGRYLCKARNPLCEQCTLIQYCKEKQYRKKEVL